MHFSFINLLGINKYESLKKQQHVNRFTNNSQGPVLSAE